MKDKYIKQVMKHLTLPRNRKSEILRDLEEAFASSGEHGETEAELIDRLGSPEEFAQSICGAPRTSRKYAGTIFCLIASILCLGGYALANAQRPASNVIGQADAMTGILIGGSGIDLPLILLCAGLVLLVSTIFMLLKPFIAHRR